MDTKAVIAVLVSIILLWNCQGLENKRILNNVETYIQDKPDSALAVLNSIDRNRLISRKQKAHFSLLYTAALEKNYIDTTDYELIRPAVEYYSRKGPLKYKMRAYYYGGSVLANANEMDKAMEMYMNALRDSAQVDDNHYKELVNSAISDIFISNHNSPEEVAYTEQALKYAINDSDSVGIWAITGHLATAYSNIQDWERSDSLYIHFFSMPICDSAVYAKRLFFYSKNFLLSNNPDPEKSVSIFEYACDNFSAVPSIEQYCYYAYANELLGRSDLANSIMAQIQELGYSSPVIDLLNYRIQKARGNYGAALNLFENAISAQDSTLLRTLQQSLVQTQRDYYSLRTNELQQENQLKSHRIVFVVTVLLFIILSLVLLYFIQRSQLEGQIADLSFMQKESKEMLDAQNRICKETNSCLEEKEQSLAMLKSQFAEMYKTQYKILNDLCSAYWAPYKNKDRKDTVYEEVKRIIHTIEIGETSNSGFVDIVNKELDNIIDHLREDLPFHQDSDFRFLSYVIAGFEAKTIANIMGLSVGSVYTKKNRLKSEILQLSSPHKDFYLEYIG